MRSLDLESVLYPPTPATCNSRSADFRGKIARWLWYDWPARGGKASKHANQPTTEVAERTRVIAVIGEKPQTIAETAGERRQKKRGRRRPIRLILLLCGDHVQ